MTFQHGMNLSSFDYYTPENQFVNAMLLAAYNPPSVKYDPVSGDPAQPGTLQAIVPVIDGTHEYTVKISTPISAVRFGSAATPIGGYTKTTADGKYKFTYTHDPSNTNLLNALLTIVPSSSNSTIGHIEVYRTEHEALLQNNKYAWCPDFLASVKGFSPLRFMDWMRTNNSPLTNTRPKPSGHMFDTVNGCPLELAADLCNTVGSDMWINIPHLASDDLIREMISVAINHLDPKLTLYVEYSNEVWNNAFSQSKYADEQAKIHYGSSYKAYYSYDNWYGFRSGQVAKIASSISPRAKTILANQLGNTTSKWERILAGYHEAGATNSMLGAIAEAPYLGCASSLSTQIQWALTSNYDAMHAELTANMNNKKPWAPVIKAYADSLGVPLFLYEYNISVDAWRVSDLAQKAALVSFQQKYCHSKRAADLIKQHATNLAAAGVSVACFFDHAGKGSQWGEWGCRPSTIATYPMYDFLREPLEHWVPGYVHSSPQIISKPSIGTVTSTNNSGPISGTYKP